MTSVEFSWTRKNIKTLKELRAAGAYASEIAALFGITKNAVVGKIDRLKLPLGIRPDSAVVIEIVDPKPVEKPKSPAPRLTATQQQLTENARKVFALRRNACRWIDGSVYEAEFQYCRAPKQSGGSSYCSVHHRMVWTRPVRS